jgi:hypothetical protein
MKCARLLSVLCTVSCGPQGVDAVELLPSSLPQGLVAHWPLDDAAGGLAVDASGNRRDGTLTGGTWLADGRFGGALRLGVGEYVTVDPFPDATPDFSVSAWVRLQSYAQDTTGENPYATVLSTEASGGWEVNVDHVEAAPRLHFGFYRGPNAGDFEGTSCLGIELDRWAQITAVVDGDGLRYSVYVDGVPCAEVSIAHAILPGSPALAMGRIPGYERYLDGDIDDIAIWSRALVGREVDAILARPVPDPH